MDEPESVQPTDESELLPTRSLCRVENLAALLRIRGIGPRGAIEIANRLGTVDRLECSTPADLQRTVGKKLAEALATQSLSSAEPSLPDGAWMLGFFDEDYPAGFRNLKDPPAVLWGIGKLPSVEAVAVVGTRHPTQWAADATRKIVTSAVEEGFVIVSGLAIGIDTTAHTTCLEAHGQTTAVLGTGVDICYPAENKELATELLAAGGCLLSEVPPGTRPSPKTLVARDRLQAALALGTVVVQSGIPGGTLHTARFTLEQGKALVVAAPRGGSDPKAYAGNLALIDPTGCDPDVLRASGALASDLPGKKPVADVVLTASEQLPSIWQTVRGWDPVEGLSTWRRQGASRRSSSTSTEHSPTLPI